MDDKRIVLINGNGSEWYEQVIFILKSPNSAKTKNLVFEAEKIINDYMISGKAGIRSQRVEQYKKRLAERPAAAPTATRQSAQAAAPPAIKKNVKRKYDFTSLFINICLVLASVLLGYVMCRVMIP